MVLSQKCQAEKNALLVLLPVWKQANSFVVTEVAQLVSKGRESDGRGPRVLLGWECSRTRSGQWSYRATIIECYWAEHLRLVLFPYESPLSKLKNKKAEAVGNILPSFQKVKHRMKIWLSNSNISPQKLKTDPQIFAYKRSQQPYLHSPKGGNNPNDHQWMNG